MNMRIRETGEFSASINARGIVQILRHSTAQRLFPSASMHFDDSGLIGDLKGLKRVASCRQLRSKSGVKCTCRVVVRDGKGLGWRKLLLSGLPPFAGSNAVASSC